MATRNEGVEPVNPLTSRNGEYTTSARIWRGDGTIYVEVEHLTSAFRTEKTDRAARRLARRNDPRSVRSQLLGVRLNADLHMVYRFVTYRS